MTHKDRRQDRVLVFIPSFGDSAILPDLVAAIRRLGPRYRPLIVDDGSANPVAADLESALYVRLPANFGLGVCTQIAFLHALRHHYYAVTRIDADGQHQVEDIPRLMAKIDSGDADVVVGERANHAVGRTPIALARRLLKAYFRLVAHTLTSGKAPRDLNSGLFAAQLGAVRVLSRTTLERYPEPEIFVTACRSGLRLATVPVRQLARAEGTSTLGFVAGIQMFFRFNVFALNELLRKKDP